VAEPGVIVSRDEFARLAAASVMSNPDALAEYEAGLLPGVPDDVAAVLDARLRRVRRGMHEDDDVTLVRGDDAAG
jgi:hypothetical protein